MIHAYSSSICGERQDSVVAADHCGVHSPSPSHIPVVLLLSYSSIAAHPPTFVSVHVLWRPWIATRLALRLEYPLATRKGGSRHHPIANLRRRVDEGSAAFDGCPLPHSFPLYDVDYQSIGEEKLVLPNDEQLTLGLKYGDGLPLCRKQPTSEMPSNRC